MRRLLALSSFVFLSSALVAGCGGASPEPTEPTSSAVTKPPPPPPVEPAPPPPPPPVESPQKAAGKRREAALRGLLDAWNAHDADKIAASYAENGTLRIVGVPDFVGRAAIKAQAADVLKAFPDFKVALTRVIAKDNQAFVEWVITGTNTGDSEAMKIKATKRPMGVHGVDVTTIDDSGLIKEMHRYYDMPTLMQQLDAKAKAGTFRPVATLPAGAPSILISKDAPAEQKALEGAKALDAAWETHKSETVIAASLPDMTVDDYTMPAPLMGVKAQKPVLDMIFKALPDVKMDIGVRIAADDLVATEHADTGTMKANMGPLKATNKPVTLHLVDIVQIKDGKAAGVWSYSNMMEMMPPPAAPPKDAKAGPAKKDEKK